MSGVPALGTDRCKLGMTVAMMFMLTGGTAMVMNPTAAAVLRLRDARLLGTPFGVAQGWNLPVVSHWSAET